MKKGLIKLLTISGAILLMLPSCKKNDMKVTADPNKQGNLSASSSNLVLDKTKLNDTSAAITFNFKSPNYGFANGATYTLQIDSAGDNWAKPNSTTLAAGELNQSFSTSDFNTLLLKLNLKAGAASNINVRVEQQLSATITSYSNTISLSVTPYSLITYVWVPGTYQNSVVSAQWLPQTADSLVSKTGNGVYTGYIYFQGGDLFKITPAKNWDSSYGDAGGGKISLSGGNISSPGKGLYLVTVNTVANTISFAAYEHTWSIIGDAAIDWSTDVPMTFNQNANAYQATTALKTTGGYKFRADADWSISYGLTNPVNGTFLTSNNGGNITPPATAGTYQVSFSFGDPLNGPFYKAVKQ